MRTVSAAAGTITIFLATASERHQRLAPHSLTDDRKGILADRIVGGDVIGRIEEALVNLCARREAIDVDRASASDLDCLQLAILDEEKLARADLIATAFS
jgi:hypothetical protein